MVRNILAGILGLIVAWIVITVMQLIGYYIWPVDVVDYNDAASFGRIIATMTAAQFIFLLVGYAVGSLCAGLAIGKIAENKGVLIPLIIGSLFTAVWIWLNVLYPHPTWVIVVGLFMYIPFTILGKNITAGTDTAGADADVTDEVGEAQAGVSDGIVEAGSGLPMDVPELSDTEKSRDEEE